MPRAPDRDEQAVLDTLTSVNPCALVDKPAGGRKVLREPHKCSLETEDHAEILVEIAERTSHADRYLLAHRVIGGWSSRSRRCGSRS